MSEPLKFYRIQDEDLECWYLRPEAIVGFGPACVPGSTLVLTLDGDYIIAPDVTPQELMGRMGIEIDAPPDGTELLGGDECDGYQERA